MTAHKKKKILFVHSSLGVGGAEVLRCTILRHFDKSLKAAYDVTVCSLENRGIIGREIETRGFRVIALNGSHDIYNPLTTWRVMQVIRRYKPDIIQCSMFNACFHGILGALLAGSRARILAEEHCPETFKRWWHKLIDRMLFRRVEKILCCSRYVCDYTARNEGLPRAKFVPLLNVVDPQRLCHTHTKTAERKRLHIGSHTKVLGIAGRLHRQKGQIYAIKAIELLSRSFPDILLLLAGDGPERARLEAYMRHHKLENHVRFLGLSKDISRFYAVLDALIVPSVQEGFGIVLLEAMCLGIPCIASDTDGIPEVIENNKTGLLFRPKDPAALASAVQRLLSDSRLRRNIMQRARKRVKKEFMPARYIEQLRTLYDA